MKISNGFKSISFTAAALCFVMMASTASAQTKEATKPAPNKVEAAKPEPRIKKAGKITEMKLDPKTNKVSATVTLGTLNKPDFSKMKAKPAERPEFITLSNETVTVELKKDKKPAAKPDHKLRERPQMHRKSFNKKQPKSCACNGQKNKKHQNFAKGKNRNFQQKSEQLKVGSIVQVVYSEDGSKAEKIKPLIPMGPKNFRR